jgi:hypothetical protein
MAMNGKPGDENLPPIVPAWAVPRPGTKKKAQPAAQAPPPEAAGQLSARPAEGQPPEVEQAKVAAQPIQPPPAMRIQLGENSPLSPAGSAPASSSPTLPSSSASSLPTMVSPPPASAAPAATHPQKTSFQRLPPIEPGLLPPVARAAQPMALEIVNPHVARTSYESPVALPIGSAVHLDDAAR